MSNSNNKKKLMNQLLRNDVFNYLKEQGFRQKGAFFIRDYKGRTDIIDVLVQPRNNDVFAGFSFALAFIAPNTYTGFTGKRQPFSFQKKFLFHIPMGVLFCANQDLIAGFDYWYEFYDNNYEISGLDFETYQNARPDITYEEYSRINEYYIKMNSRFDHEEAEDFMNVLKKDFETILEFFNQLPSDEDMIATFKSEPPKNKIQSLMYNSFIEYAKYYKKDDLAIAMQLMENTYQNTKKQAE